MYVIICTVYEIVLMVECTCCFAFYLYQEVPAQQSQVAPGPSVLPGISEEPNYQAVTDQNQPQTQPLGPSAIYQVSE